MNQGTSLITGVKLWKHEGKEWRFPLQRVEANGKGAFDFADGYTTSTKNRILKREDIEKGGIVHLKQPIHTIPAFSMEDGVGNLFLR